MKDSISSPKYFTARKEVISANKKLLKGVSLALQRFFLSASVSVKPSMFYLGWVFDTEVKMLTSHLRVPGIEHRPHSQFQLPANNVPQKVASGKSNSWAPVAHMRDTD